MVLGAGDRICRRFVRVKGDRVLRGGAWLTKETTRRPRANSLGETAHCPKDEGSWEVEEVDGGEGSETTTALWAELPKPLRVLAADLADYWAETPHDAAATPDCVFRSTPAGSGQSHELKQELRQRRRDRVAAVVNPVWRKCAALAGELCEPAAIAALERKKGARAEEAEQALAELWEAVAAAGAPVLSGTCHAVRRDLQQLAPEAIGRIFLEEVGQCQPLQLAGLFELGHLPGRPRKLRQMFKKPAATLFRFHPNVARFACDLFRGEEPEFLKAETMTSLVTPL